MFEERGIEALKQIATEQAISKTQLQAIAQFVHRCVVMFINFASASNAQSGGTAPSLVSPPDTVNSKVPPA